jgi:hypothetical protein
MVNVNRRFGETYNKKQETRTTLRTEDVRSSKTLVNYLTTRRHIPEVSALHSYRCGNVKTSLSFIADMDMSSLHIFLFVCLFVCYVNSILSMVLTICIDLLLYIVSKTS